VKLYPWRSACQGLWVDKTVVSAPVLAASPVSVSIGDIGRFDISGSGAPRKILFSMPSQRSLSKMQNVYAELIGWLPGFA
jgi:hypothetical protein